MSQAVRMTTHGQSAVGTLGISRPASTRTSSHGGMLRLPKVTESTNRECLSCRNFLKSIDNFGLRIRVPVAGRAVLREQRFTLLDLYRRKSRVLRPDARTKKCEAEGSSNPHSSRNLSYSGINANVHTDPPVGVRSATFMTRLRTPPMPDRTVTYWRPLCV